MIAATKTRAESYCAHFERTDTHLLIAVHSIRTMMIKLLAIAAFLVASSPLVTAAEFVTLADLQLAGKVDPAKPGPRNYTSWEPLCSCDENRVRIGFEKF